MASLRVLCEAFLPDHTVRVWDGSGGVFVDELGNMYRPAEFTEGALQQLEAAINGEAYTLSLSLISLSSSVADQIWQYDETQTIQGSIFVVKLKVLDNHDQPDDKDPIVVFTGTIDNLDVIDEATDDGVTSRVNIEVTNRFTLRTLTSGSVLSDVDQRARARLLNPAAPDDRFCERVPRMRDKTIKWPNW